VAITAYLRMRERGGFTTGESTQQAAQEFKEAVDPVATFLRERTVTGPNTQVDRARLADEYEDWCEKELHRPPLGRRRFFTRVRKDIPTIVEKTVNGRPTWVGMGLKVGVMEG